MHTTAENKHAQAQGKPMSSHEQASILQLDSSTAIKAAKKQLIAFADLRPGKVERGSSRIESVEFWLTMRRSQAP